MLKKLYFCETNAYNMIVSVDNDNNCRYLTEMDEFPYIVNMDEGEAKETARKFLEEVEDDSSWKDDCTYDQIFNGIETVLAEIEKEL